MSFQTNAATFPVIQDTGFVKTYNQLTVMGWFMPSQDGLMNLWYKNAEWWLYITGTDGVDFRAGFFSDYTGSGAQDGEWQSSDDSVQVGVPVHIAASQDRDTPGQGLIYINGIQDTVTLSTAAGGKRTSGNYHRILTSWNGNNPYYGRSADLRLYDRVLSAAEIEAIATGRGGDNIIDDLMDVRLMGDEYEPGNAVGATEIVNLGFNGNVFSGAGGATITYEDDPFGVSTRIQRMVAS
jgi:hypothetical protein